MASEKLTLIFPVETISRELDARLVLASLYGQKHHRIILAQSSHANRLAANLPGGGLYVGKHIVAKGGEKLTDYYRAKENNFTVMHLSEEGAVFMGGPKDWECDLDWEMTVSSLFPEDYIATWGNWQREYFLKKGAPAPERLKATGHPRFDIYKNGLRNIYREDAERFRQKFGDFVLFNSNFSWVLNPLGLTDTFSEWQGYYPQDQESTLRFVQRWGRQNRVYADFVELLHRLAVKHPKLNIVVRPHPSDDIKQMEAVFRGISNIYVVRENSVAPWILASRVVLNDGCTTAIEAYLMGKQVVNFTPVQNEGESFLPNLLGVRVLNQSDAIKAIEQAKESSWREKELTEMAHHIFSNFRHDSMKLFLNFLEEAEMNSLRTKAMLTPGILADQIQSVALESAKRIARKLFFEKRYKAATATRTLFPGFNRSHIRSKLDAIEKITRRHIDLIWYSSNVIELRPTSFQKAQWPL